MLSVCPFEETYRPVPGGGEVPSGSGEKDAESVTFSGDILDITPEVLNSIILSLPMKALCKEDCPGLCPRCGSNLKDGQCGCESENIDPRLNVLKDFSAGQRNEQLTSRLFNKWDHYFRKISLQSSYFRSEGGVIMGVPKRKASKQRGRQRRAANLKLRPAGPGSLPAMPRPGQASSPVSGVRVL